MDLRFVLMALLVPVACTTTAPPSDTTTEANRLRRSIQPYRASYQASLPATAELTTRTLQWLSADAIHASRSQAVAQARHLMDAWSKVYFVPRHMHEQLRGDRYRDPTVRDIHKRILDHLHALYFELHDYQRYAQHASETAMHHTLAGRLPVQLSEFDARLRSRKPPRDEIAPLLAALP